LRAFVGSVVILLAATVGTTAVPDWPQWQGPQRTNISTETGLLKSWPAAGPEVAWSVKGLGMGYGAVAIAGDRIYVQGTRGASTVVHALGRADGKPVWVRPLGNSLSQERGGGPRGTPTIDGDRVYALTEAGNLACLRTLDGSIFWTRNILKDFGGSNPNWLISESPLVDGDNLIVSPGGRGASIVALNKMTGATVWTSRELSDSAAYSSCIAADVHGIRTIMNFTASSCVGVRAADGKLLWKYDKAANDTGNIATPVYSNNRVFFTSAYGTGGALLELAPESGGLSAREVYFSRDMMNHHGGVVLVNGYLYGFSNSILTCLDFNTGKPTWKDRSVGKGSVTFADGMLFLLSEENVAGLAEANPSGYVERGRFRIEDQGWPSWAHPVVCGGRLYIRNQGMLTSYNVAAK
jgi:outer membrane protein assembly factor BamB